MVVLGFAGLIGALLLWPAWRSRQRKLAGLGVGLYCAGFGLWVLYFQTNLAVFSQSFPARVGGLCMLLGFSVMAAREWLAARYYWQRWQKQCGTK